MQIQKYNLIPSKYLSTSTTQSTVFSNKHTHNSKGQNTQSILYRAALDMRCEKVVQAIQIQYHLIPLFTSTCSICFCSTSH